MVVALLSCGRGGRVLAVYLADNADVAPSGRIRIEMPQGEAPPYAEPTPVLDERDFKSVSVGRDDLGLPQISLCFAAQGRDKFT
jgi:hypothetical protein